MTEHEINKYILTSLLIGIELQCDILIERIDNTRLLFWWANYTEILESLMIMANRHKML